MFVKIGEYIGFRVCRRSCLIWSPVIVVPAQIGGHIAGRLLSCGSCLPFLIATRLHSFLPPPITEWNQQTSSRSRRNHRTPARSPRLVGLLFIFLGWHRSVRLLALITRPTASRRPAISDRPQGERTSLPCTLTGGPSEIGPNIVR